MLLAELVRTSEEVAATRARTKKIQSIAGVLSQAAPEEIAVAVALLSGEPRQGRIGVGYRTLYSLPPQPATEPSLTVLDLDLALTELQALGGPGSQSARAALLTTLFERCTAAEAEYVRLLLTGGMRQGAQAGVVAEAIAVAASVPSALVRRAAMLAGDLPATAALAASGGAEALEAVGLEVGRAVQPMLASTAADVAEAVESLGRCSVEWKLDGARIQAHRDGDEVRLYTRNLNDVTERLPGVVDLMRSLPVTATVLDGEVLGLREDDSPTVFQEVMSSFSRRNDNDESTLRGSGNALVIRFFDILHLDGRDLLDEPLERRLEVLERIAGPWRVPAICTDDPAEGAAMLDNALSHRHEGVMVKALDSPYEAGRRGSAWRKVKPVLTFDLVVLGVEWGSGRRKGWLSNIHLGARDASSPGEFVMVGKTFKGMTDAMLEWQTARFLELERAREEHVVWVRPEQVVEIAIDGVQRSTRYPGGVALRFARVKGYRDDKSPGEADTIDSIRALVPGL